MKKLLLSLAFIFAISLNMNAQYGKRPNPRYHRHHAPYEEESRRFDYGMNGMRFHVMGSIGCGDVFRMLRHARPDMFMIGGMFEYQVARPVALGVGVEFYGSDAYRSPLNANIDRYMLSLPVYANVRLMAPLGYVRPFIEGRIGYSIPLASAYSYNYGVQYQADGLFTGGAIGLIVGHSNFSFGINVSDIYRADSQAVFKNAVWAVSRDFYFRYSYAFGAP